MRTHSRWGKTALRTPDGMTFKEWRVSPEYKASFNEYCHRRYVDNKDNIKAKSQKFENTARGRASSLIHSCKSRALKKGLSVEIDINWVEERLKAGVCEITGVPFVFIRGAKKKDPFSPSIDRIDNSLGYTKKNSRVVLWAVNAAIADFGISIYMDVAKLVIKNIEGAHQCPR